MGPFCPPGHALWMAGVAGLRPTPYAPLDATPTTGALAQWRFPPARQAPFGYLPHAQGASCQHRAF
eukprot:5873109-Pyramimonas_sp.AAC.1